MRVAVLFDNFGPYHIARLRATSSRCDLLAIEFGGVSGIYKWENADGAELESITLNPSGPSSELTFQAIKKSISSALTAFQPDLVFIPGWASKPALIALSWCLDNCVPAVVMSESTAWDRPRNRIGEGVKRQILRMFSSALVGGSPHRDYVGQLGMNTHAVFLGYNAVDNAFFERESRKWRRPKPSLPRSYFLASNRFIERKNLPRLIEAYSQYHALQATTDSGLPGWNLCLLGSGEVKDALVDQCHRLGLQVEECAPWESPTTEKGQGTTVFFPGFRQLDELPRFYAHAGCFIHPALTEPWGLVVNEAMACGLPVIVSERVGCSQDLVEEGVNGFRFDPTNVEELAGHMSEVARLEFPRDQFGAASERIILNNGPEAFAVGLEAAAGKAIEVGPMRPTITDRALLGLLCRVR